MPDRAKLAQEWLARGDNDMQTAKLALQAGAPTDTIAGLLQQAVEKCLKGYLISQGWRLKNTHNLVELVDKATGYDTVFHDYLDIALRLTAYYFEARFEARYPPGPPTEYPREEITRLLEQADKLIAKIKEAEG